MVAPPRNRAAIAAGGSAFERRPAGELCELGEFETAGQVFFPGLSLTPRRSASLGPDASERQPDPALPATRATLPGWAPMQAARTRFPLRGQQTIATPYHKHISR